MNAIEELIDIFMKSPKELMENLDEYLKKIHSYMTAANIVLLGCVMALGTISDTLSNTELSEDRISSAGISNGIRIVVEELDSVFSNILGQCTEKEG